VSQGRGAPGTGALGREGSGFTLMKEALKMVPSVQMPVDAMADLLDEDGYPSVAGIDALRRAQSFRIRMKINVLPTPRGDVPTQRLTCLSICERLCFVSKDGLTRRSVLHAKKPDQLT
jgi:hypothetical protein